MDTFFNPDYETRQYEHTHQTFDHPALKGLGRIRDVSDVELSDRLPQIPAYLDRLTTFCDGLWSEAKEKLQDVGCRDLAEYRRHLKVLIYHLAWAATDPDNDGKLVVPFHASRYGKQVKGRQSLSFKRTMRLIDVFEHIRSDSLIPSANGRWWRYKGFQTPDGKSGRPSQLCSHPRFLNEMAQAGLLPCPKPHDKPKPASKRGIVRVRPQSKGGDEPGRKRNQKRLGRTATKAELKLGVLNVLIEKAEPRVVLRSYDDYRLTLHENKETGKSVSVINDDKHRFYRLFNDRDGEGGRIWGSYLQRLRSQLRSQILLNGEPVCELDYSSMQVCLAYSIEGLELPTPTDCYAIPGFDASYRELFKLVFTISIGCGIDEDPVPIIRHKAGKLGWPKLTMARTREVYDAFWSYHDAILRFRCSGSWRELQNLESEIALNVISQFVDRGLPIIPIHDGFVAQARYRDELGLAMETAVERLSAKPMIKVC